MLDPRLSIIEDRLSNIERIIVVSSGKGGVGKSIITSTIALILAREGFKVGLLDLDFTSPTTHIALGVSAEKIQPIEDRGIVPPEVHGIKYMSLIFYLGDKAAPLRGNEISNALLEVLAITRWGKLDFLLVDMPPGIGDLMLDVLKYFKRANFLIITSSSKMAFETVRKLLLLLRGLGAEIMGVIENIKLDDSTYIRREVNALGEKFLGEIHFDENLEEAIGSVEKLLKTKFADEVRSILWELLKT
ncbi:P-loop NTPase [Candidatus Bathyarchaeota archaeon]|nr:P-loop NTPase [Candidatus Bathyarchaeota archaeon]